MSRSGASGLWKRYRSDGTYEWHIDKRVKRFGRLCESTGTSDEEEAARYLARRLEEIRQAAIYGTRPRRRFREAAARYLNDFAWKKSIERDARALKDLDPFIGDLWLDCVHNDSFRPYVEKRRRPSEGRKALAAGTLNRNLAVARRILNLAARLWRDEGSNLSWLAQAPLIQLERNSNARKPYPIDWVEQRLLFAELPSHLEEMALFDVNTGLRSGELCALRWEWEQRVPELDTPEIKRTVFVLPGSVTKNGEARVVVLNDIAQSVIESVRGRHPTYVFTWWDRRKHRRVSTGRVTNSGWRKARRRAAARYEQELRRPLPLGFKRLRVHDLRHTFGRRLRAVGVSLEDRQDLLGHKSGRMTTHYSAAELGNLLAAVNRIANSRESPAGTVLRLVG